MIKQIVKRDGRLEEFTPHKINGWGEWASQELAEFVDWSSVVMHTVAALPEQVTSQVLQEQLIKTCLNEGTWSYYCMAGRLYAVLLRKKIFGGKIPSVLQVHQNLIAKGLMRPLDFSAEEYRTIEGFIEHDGDFYAPHFSLHHVREKYSVKNRLTGEEYETQQFVYMRMAMALAEDQPADRRMRDLLAWYEHFSNNRINAPTPNYVNLGTHLRGYASCCLYTTHDDWKSLSIGDHIAYSMTCMSAGIGNNINTRSVGNPVRKGLIKHQGRKPYLRSLVGAVKANLQNGRGGACTTYYSAFDPEFNTISKLKNPMSTEDNKIRGIDYNMMANKFFARKAAKKEPVFTFNSFTAPDLWDAFYSADIEKFEAVYARYENDESFVKNYIDAREGLITVLNEAYETGRAYLSWMDEINSHTPYNEKIYSSNLCAEITQPTQGYVDMIDLYSDQDHGRGEVSTCSLGAIVVSNIESDEQYEDTMYYTLLMIDKCIHQSEYALPHVGVTAKARMNAGVGIMGLAHHMARNGVHYDTAQGKRFMHEVAERHAYLAIKASLRLGKELGNAPWMSKTKWPAGWMPIDTYNRNVDGIVEPNYKRNWESLREQVIENGGIRNSSLVAYMPGEASSKASKTSNSIYPVRELAMLKSDDNTVVYWAAPEGERLANDYQMAWDISTKDMIDTYAIFQKFTDQAISADLYRRIGKGETVSTSEMLKDYFYMTKVGMKTRYYMNTKTSEGTNLEEKSRTTPPYEGPERRRNAATEPTEAAVLADGAAVKPAWENEGDERGCAGGSCTL